MSFGEVTLDTERLTLKRVRGQSHGKQINHVVCDTFHSLEPWMMWCKEKPTIEETVRSLSKITDDARNYVFGIYLPEVGLIGLCNLVYEAEKGPRYEVGYWLHSAHQGRGYTTECVFQLIRFAKNVLKANCLFLTVDNNNEASKRVVEKVGFTFVGSKNLTYDLRPDWGTRTNLRYELRFH